MNKADILSNLLLRAGSDVAGTGIVTPDEVSTWPAGVLADLIEAGILVQSQPESVASCDACFNDHSEPVQIVATPRDRGQKAYMICPEAGRISVDVARLARWRIDIDRLEATVQVAAAPKDPERESQAGATLTHSPDYSTVVVNGRTWKFVGTQAKAIGVFVEQWKLNGITELNQQFVITEIESNAKRLRDIFKASEAWGILIVDTDRPGFYRLKLD